MKYIAPVCGMCALGLTLAPPALFALGQMAEQSMKSMMLFACILWFIAAPAFMKGGAK